MANTRLSVLCAVMIVALTSNARAGPCSPAIERMQARIDARLDAMAAAGPGTKEGIDALAHRQPTPGSIATAEESLRDVSNTKVASVKLAMGRALAADSAGDTAACERALADVERLIGP